MLKGAHSPKLQFVDSVPFDRAQKDLHQRRKSSKDIDYINQNIKPEQLFHAGYPNRDTDNKFYVNNYIEDTAVTPQQGYSHKIAGVTQKSGTHHVDVKPKKKSGPKRSKSIASSPVAHMKAEQKPFQDGFNYSHGHHAQSTKNAESGNILVNELLKFTKQFNMHDTNYPGQVLNSPGKGGSTRNSYNKQISQAHSASSTKHANASSKIDGANFQRSIKSAKYVEKKSEDGGLNSVSKSTKASNSPSVDNSKHIKARNNSVRDIFQDQNNPHYQYSTSKVEEKKRSLSNVCSTQNLKEIYVEDMKYSEAPTPNKKYSKSNMIDHQAALNDLKHVANQLDFLKSQYQRNCKENVESMSPSVSLSENKLIPNYGVSSGGKMAQTSAKRKKKSSYAEDDDSTPQTPNDRHFNENYPRNFSKNPESQSQPTSTRGFREGDDELSSERNPELYYRSSHLAEHEGMDEPADENELPENAIYLAQMFKNNIHDQLKTNPQAKFLTLRKQIKEQRKKKADYRSLDRTPMSEKSNTKSFKEVMRGTHFESPKVHSAKAQGYGNSQEEYLQQILQRTGMVLTSYKLKEKKWMQEKQEMAKEIITLREQLNEVLSYFMK